MNEVLAIAYLMGAMWWLGVACKAEAPNWLFDLGRATAVALWPVGVFLTIVVLCARWRKK